MQLPSQDPADERLQLTEPRPLYSQHYLDTQVPPPSDQAPQEAIDLDDRRPRPQQSLMGAVGVMALVGLIWGVAELWQSSLQVEAQEGQAPVAEVAAVPPPKTPWESASFPVEEFVAYTSPFGYRNHPYGGRRFHYGLDIAAPMGSYIRAWWEGTVVEVSDDTACGTSVVVESYGWLHIYCHMQGYVVIEEDGDRWMVDHDGGVQIRQGDLVKSGQRIGRIGMTGRTTGPHLHWGMKYQGNWIDPSVILKAMLES